MKPKLVLVEGIPIVQTGIEYPLSTGPATFTEKDLEDIVLAAEKEPGMSRPRLKIGHVEDDSWGGGEPSFGNWLNLRLSADKQQVIADLETFDWFADLLPVAYPSRSIEGSLNVSIPETGGKYSAVVTAVVLLGVQLPGVSTISDLRDVLETGAGILAGYNSVTKQVLAQVDVESVSRSFYNDVAVDNKRWYWIRSVRLEPNEVIATDDDTGKLYSIPFTVDGDKVEWGDMVEVIIRYEQKESEPAPIAGQRVLASWDSAASSRKSNRQEVIMDIKEIAKLLGLAEDAGEDEIREALQSRTESEESVGVTQEEVESKVEVDEAETEEVEEKELVTASKDVVQIDRGTFEDLKANAKLGAEARAEQIRIRRADKIEAAIQAGKIPVARRDHWSKMMIADEDGTTALLDTLEAGLIPVGPEVGHSKDGLEAGRQDETLYFEDFLTEAEKARVRKARGGQS